ncbi:amidase [Bradyrhizobium sp. U87765 SZCCT0131]|uniref:amidase n=1 Tax=unclassified Bradyrhizobium TaxID=2631580 RepID=UPI001BAD321B|nr:MULTISPECIES: amidase [unclassified Bradyrhizobium]MBR1221958.1 amidase [Bradyrhizobium sp. U87765 SZCCT0131]MBR1263844.1 amidase [Bradyrhizobium sp. U87765 SZCCT0134]MBR1302586.1 amidase [Bradyrhizobium sp. U87765 SZCCT0110]MBR1320094.1 amidase [Bradyrhizobium sp. U87765 SZCCT0109]MBR1348793.1 amidase [Bradyrhizobium sp. U87765 SZCCT0048]
MSHDLVTLGAVAVHRLLARGEVTSAELVEAAAKRIAMVEPAVNALPTLSLERARAQAEAADQARRAGRATLLGGLPIVVKDNNDVAGVRTTSGTPIFRDRVAEVSDRTVARLEANGAIVLGKSNLSELGGAQTTNAVHGATRNPYDTRLTCGGSSGGAAVALATGEAWLAHGNDLGGSLRIPAAFCNVTGLRPTPGRVPRKRLANPFDTMAVEGPMARDVADLALMFDAMVGYDPGDLLTSPGSEPPFRDAAAAPLRPERLAVSVDLGALPIAAEIRAAMAGLTDVFARAGVAITHASPDVTGTMDAFLALRGASFLSAWDPFLPAQHALFPPPVMEDIERGRHQAGVALAAAERTRADLYRRTIDFLDTHRFLVCPATQAMPFDIGTLYLHELEGRSLSTYIDWIAITAIWSLTGCPAIAIPIGFSQNGLPIGIQILAHPRREADLFQLAAWIERELALPCAPINPRPTAQPHGGDCVR